MDYPLMQDQPRPGLSKLGRYRLDPRRRAILIGGIMALVGVGILLRPRNRNTGPTEGDDIATLATLVNLPAVPLSAHWAVAPMTAADSGRTPGPNDWSLDATMIFAPADAERVTGADVFYKAPLMSGRLMRVDDTHFHLVLNTQ
jgi:hypothetical protein